MSKKKTKAQATVAEDSFELPEINEFSEELDSEQLWEMADDAQFSFDGEADENDANESLSADDIGALLSVIADRSEPDDRPEPMAEAQPAPETSGEDDAEEPSFETIQNEGDDAAIRELIADPELREAYLNDALKCLSSMEQCALSLESEPSNNQPVQQFCRELHTLKGASASVGLSELASYLHDLETNLEELFQSKAKEIDVEPMFAAVDRVRDNISAIVPNETDSTSPAPTNSTAPTNRASDFSGFSSNDDASIRIRAAKLDRLMDMLAELVVLRNRRESHASEFNNLNEELTRCATRLRFAEESDEAYLGQSPHPSRSGSQTISEIAKDITVVAQELSDLQTPVSHDNQSISRFIRDFRQELMQLRRVPISGLFQRLQRAVRDAANAEKKKVQLEILGGDTGLEQEIQERLYEPLMHIVRNAVSHGIEAPEQRQQTNKSARGTVTVSAHSNAQQLIVKVQDDGRGIDYPAVRNRAIEKGLITATQPITNQELGKLIFHPGFSTRDQASEISGRGVGMDIVSAAIEQLRGRIDIDSTPGRGTTMQISIPLRTGIEHVMVFRSANQLFALPMQSVKAINEHETGGSVSMSFNDVLSLGGRNSTISQERLILRTLNGSADSQNLSLAVDEIVGPEEVVVRGLPAMLQQHPLLCGVTLSGAGETVLLLDSQSIETFCLAQRDIIDATDATNLDQEDASDQPRALVVDDSLTARKVLVKKLQTMGIASIEASDGLEALERLRSESVDFVFTDLDMPRLGGIELLSDIKTQKYTSAPVIIVSSRDDDEFRGRAVELGAAAYLNKPVDHKSFTHLMEELRQANNSNS